jgi:hypothetical protein
VKVKLFIDLKLEELRADCFISTRLGMKHTTINLPILSGISRARTLPERTRGVSNLSNNPPSLPTDRISPGKRYSKQDSRRAERRLYRRQELR